MSARLGVGARRLLAAAAAAAIALPGSPARGTVRVADPGCGEMRVPMRDGLYVYTLPRRFLNAGSDTVRLGGATWRAGADYVLDGTRGELRLLRAPAPGETLAVRACWLIEPPPTELRALRYRPALGSDADTAAAAPAGAAGVRRAGSGFERAAAWRSGEGSTATLALRGNKTIAVDFGSHQDAFLRQSLDLALSGSLAPGVELTGVLSDRNLPLTAAGSTQDLESLDRVRVELRAPQGSAALGDVGLALDQGEFARLERRLEGMSGEWTSGAFRTAVAAATAPGEFHRLQFVGAEGRQGPYLLTDREGGLGITVVAGSEVVTVDGRRMTRGESADYAIDYERARVTFTNRRPISSASRITVDYQYAVNRYKRHLLAAGGRFQSGPAFGWVQTLAEGDDRGRPLDVTLGVEDRARLEAAGDSAVRAFGGGVAPGAGDYDTLHVDARVVYVWAGRDSGRFAVEFARVPAGSGEYADAGVVDGRTVYHWVGPGKGSFTVGRKLPLPESHRLWAAGGGFEAGALRLEVEGAVSQLDRNLFSRLEDGDNRGEAGRLSLRLEGEAPGPLPGRAGLEVQARAVGDRFQPFGRLERPFAEEDWGLAAAADLERQRRAGVSGFYRAPGLGELRAGVARLAVPGGSASLRRELDWSRTGAVAARLRLERADAEQRGRAFPHGGRQRARGDLRWALPWLEPALRFESDVRRAPSDTGRVAARSREGGVELGTGRALAWRAAAGLSVRRDADQRGGRFVERGETRVVHVAIDSPAERSYGVALAYQRRDLVPLADPLRARSDLGSLRLRGEDARRGLSASLGIEMTAEGENRRERRLVPVGPGRGAYDAFGNLVGDGDHDLVITVSPELERLARSATSLLLAWRFGNGGPWRGSRLQLDFESEARRSGSARPGDPFPSPGTVAFDPALARGSVVQRIEADLAPASRAAAFRLRAERRVSGDRSYANFAQWQDERSLSARWRARAAAAWTGELEARLARRAAAQTVTLGAAYRRTLVEGGGEARLIYAPGARLRAAFAGDALWSRAESRDQPTLTLRLGPDLGISVGERGRAELGLRRALVSGPPALGLVPSIDPAGAAEWEGSGRFDYRLRESVHCGLSLTGRDRAARDPQLTGRAELRAFF